MNHFGFTATIKKITELSDNEIERWEQLQFQCDDLKRAFLSYLFCCAVAVNHPFVRVCVVRKQQNIVAFFPFQFKDSFHARLKVAERVGGEISDYFGIVADRNFVITPKKLAVLAGINLLQFTHLDHTQFNYGLSGDSPEQGLLIQIGSSSEDYFYQLKDSNNKLVGDTARRQRKIEKDIGTLRFCFNVEDEIRKQCLFDLIDCKRNQYLRTGVSDSLIEKWKRAVLLELLSSDNQLCKGVLSTLYAGDVWVASHFGLQCEKLLHFWFPVYNNDLSKYSPGRLLMNQIITQAPLQQQPVLVIDRGAGITKAKTDFANAEHLYYRGEISMPSMETLSYKMFCSLKWRLQKLRK